MAAAARSPGAGRSRMEEYLMLALKVMIALVVLHMVGWEMSQEPDLLLASTNLRHRLDGIKTTQAEVQGLVDARRGGGAAAAAAAAPEPPAAPAPPPPPPPSPRPTLAPSPRPTAPPRRADAEAPPLGGVVLVVMAHDRAASVRDCLLRACGRPGGAPRRRRFHGRAGRLRRPRARGGDGGRGGGREGPRLAPRLRAAGRRAGGSRATLPRRSRARPAALAEAFRVPGAEFALLLEDDLRVAGDFFDLFAFAAVELGADASLWCASAWNDNAGPAAAGFDWRPGVLRRTTYFPGLGWMVGKATFERDFSGRVACGADDGLGPLDPGRDARRRPRVPLPEVPRVRHAATGGSTNVRGSEAAALERHAFAGDASAVRAFELAPSDLAGAVGGAPRVALGDVGNLPRGASNPAADVLRAFGEKTAEDDESSDDDEAPAARLYETWRSGDGAACLALGESDALWGRVEALAGCQWASRRIRALETRPRATALSAPLPGRRPRAALAAAVAPLVAGVADEFEICADAAAAPADEPDFSDAAFRFAAAPRWRHGARRGRAGARGPAAGPRRRLGTSTARTSATRTANARVALLLPIVAAAAAAARPPPPLQQAPPGARWGGCDRVRRG
ncbi:hypothetical protein SO694_00026030 [Aureococcus anophagefferens]|uniref:alpha-1,3-mannosyl-glycoprotein 2-beta-N-acetylglucosaminyltransferase n=1 Tax=Aureococcus anophagefferens TaxID=44056 RepID=A0ABR1FUC4_AURAN